MWDYFWNENFCPTPIDTDADPGCPRTKELERPLGGSHTSEPPRVLIGRLDISSSPKGPIIFGIGRDQVLGHQWVDNGPGWAVVRLATAQEVLELEPDLSLILETMIGAIGAYPQGSQHAFEMRTFAPGVGVVEDAVCGSMNASVGQWLTRTGQVSCDYRVSQGSRLDRNGDIAITADADGTVWVGGTTTTLFRGTALI